MWVALVEEHICVGSPHHGETADGAICRDYAEEGALLEKMDGLYLLVLLYVTQVVQLLCVLFQL